MPALPIRSAALALLIAAAAMPARAGTVETSAGRMEITAMAKGLDEPWGLAFLPDGRFLVTERDGRLTLFSAPGAGPIRGTALAGLPGVFAEGQGGMLDVMILRDFATSREVWLSYSAPMGRDAATAVGKGRLSEDETTLTGFTQLFAGDPTDGGRHFGSRLVEARDGSIFLTTGDRGTGPEGLQAQDPGRVEGKVIHLNRDGSPATRLPGARPGVFSLGHRNPQGAALDRSGTLWLVEHGAQGGDEVNRITEGRNYGWPIISYGKNYNDDKIGIGTKKPGLEQPVFYWDPSIAPSGLMIHSGAIIPEWTGDFFTGSLKFDYLSRLDPDQNYAEERISAPETGRVRDVREGPDGAIWFLSVNDGAVYRMAPAD